MVATAGAVSLALIVSSEGFRPSRSRKSSLKKQYNNVTTWKEVAICMLGTMYFWNKFQFCSSMPTYSCLPVTCTCTWTSSSLQENLQTGKNTDHKLLLVECIQLLSTVYLILRVSLKYLFLSWSISKNSPPSAENM